MTGIIAYNVYDARELTTYVTHTGCLISSNTIIYIYYGLTAHSMHLSSKYYPYTHTIPTNKN